MTERCLKALSACRQVSAIKRKLSRTFYYAFDEVVSLQDVNYGIRESFKN